jgi:hypothetical protein
VTLRWSGTGLAAGQAAASGASWSIASIAYPAGDFAVAVSAVDAAGNVGAPVTVAIHKRPGVLFVRKGQNGNGTSWQAAYGELWQAMAARGAATEIWVADGEYPSASDGAGPLDIPSSVTVYGGFPADGTGLNPADRLLADLKTLIRCDGAATGHAVRMLGQKSVLDGFRINAAGGGLQGDSDNIARNLWILNAGGNAAVDIVAGGKGKGFRLERCRIEGALKALKAALSVGAKAKVEIADCTIAGNAASAAPAGGGIWLDADADLKATGLGLSGNTVADSAGARALQMRVEDKANADVQGTVEGGAAGIEVAPGGKVKLNGADVP